jgi:hypothetical protein
MFLPFSRQALVDLTGILSLRLSRKIRKNPQISSFSPRSAVNASDQYK